MKKLIAFLLTAVLTLSLFTSCFLFENQGDGGNSSDIGDDNRGDYVKIRIGYMAGPTGMGMAKLISENGGLENGNERYSFTKYVDTSAAKADLAAGKVDIICLPTNEAAMYYNTVSDNVKVLAINCLNSLYMIMNKGTIITSFNDFAGQSPYVLYTCKNGTPRMVLEYIIEAAGIDAVVSYEIDGKEILTPADLSAMVIADKIPNAIMPEPLVTSTLMTRNNSTPYDHLRWAVKVDISDEWAKVSETPVAMGCIVGNADFINSNQGAVNAFLTEYKVSVDYIGNSDNINSAAEYVVETEVMAAASAAEMALANLGDAISYIDGEDMKETLIAFYTAIGIALPDESFYYAK